MRRILTATGVEKSYGDRSILRGADLTADLGERVGLVGVNGSGKSTLLRLITGIEGLDHGTIDIHGSVGALGQNPSIPGATVGEALDAAIGWHRQLVADFEAASAAHDTAKAARLHDRLDHVGWTQDHKIAAMADRLGVVDRDAPLDRLSGGERRRLALARALLGAPDLLILDEPTNHLDADTIEWLEAWLQGFRGALVLVTHDRYLLEAVATRIVEVERGETVSYDGSYADYLIARAERQERLAADQQRHVALLAREAAWASRSPAARTTKQRARLKRLDELKERELVRTGRPLSLDLRSGARKGGPLLELHDIHHGYDGRTLLQDLSLVLQAGDRVGIMGPNGAGKSTLMSIVAGRLSPDRGQRHAASRLNLAIMDQHRTGMDPDALVFDVAGDGNDHVFIDDKPTHVATFLERFQFPRETHTQRVGTLSGGERARLLLARLILHGANLLLLDEPTNDLDLFTLRVLEEALLEYDGALLVITHDRAFLDRVCNAVLSFEPGPQVVRYADRSQARAAMQALRQEEQAAAEQAAAEQAAAEQAAAPPAPAPAPARRAGLAKRLSSRERRELAELPARIEVEEEKLEALNARLADPQTYRELDREGLAELTAAAGALGPAIEALYERWTELEARAE
jgi:ATP-binding cassette subfamily F protein uup